LAVTPEEGLSAEGRLAPGRFILGSDMTNATLHIGNHRWILLSFPYSAWDRPDHRGTL
jgi:hypothetical protein